MVSSEVGQLVAICQRKRGWALTIAGALKTVDAAPTVATLAAVERN
jgi:hypothetical protein